MRAWETIRERKMTGIDPERLERRLRWAAEQLELSPDASLDEVRAAWLRRLPAEDFVPSSELRWALTALLRRSSEGGAEARADEAAAVAEEERLRGEVEAFAEQFWEVPSEERRRRWEELRGRCAFAPALRARLHLLEAGLDCVATVDEAREEARVVTLANHIREWFILRPGPRARVQQDLLQAIQEDRKAWKAAARRLRRVCPKLAALGNDLLDSFAKKLRQQLAAANARGNLRWAKLISASCIIGVAVSLLAGFAIHLSPPPSTMPTRPRQNSGDDRFPPAVWEKVNEIRGLTKEELTKRIEEELRRREQNPPDVKGDKKARKNP